jgi:hypothetical protein
MERPPLTVVPCQRDRRSIFCRSLWDPKGCAGLLARTSGLGLSPRETPAFASQHAQFHSEPLTPKTEWRRSKRLDAAGLNDAAVENAVAGGQSGGPIHCQFRSDCCKVLGRACGLFIEHPLVGESVHERASSIAYL